MGASLLLISTPSPRSSLVLPRAPCKCDPAFRAKRQQRPICLGFPRLKGRKSSCYRRTDPRCSSSSASAVTSSSSSSSSERWVLDPAGDGDWRHIGYKVPRPGAFEIASDSMTVGRVAEEADIVLPVATVSGTHARLEKKGGALLVTDLDSTNGTYVNERRLVPGFPVPVDPGSLLIFGDIHLAMFRVSKRIAQVPAEAEQDNRESQTQPVSAAVEETTS